ncbi:hypothetical protein ACJD0Z_12385 [Flavobacteriaceae bacterium M23B6Z8]
MKSLLQVLLLLLCVNCSIHSSLGQSKIDTITLKKGEVFDILLLSQNPKTEANLKSYFQIAFPVAKKMSYQPLPGFKVMSNNQGNLQPQFLILGKWRDIELREDFLAQIVEEVPDFHERRRSIWSYFGLRYFEVEENVSFKIHREQYQVATAYWLESEKQSSEFYKKWIKEVQESGGEILVHLTDGKSPFGYQYNPDYFVITSWKNEAVFKDFQEKIIKLKWDNIQHVNEFILE